MENVAVDGHEIPGLDATFFRRGSAPAIETVGVYRLGGRDLFMAWGYVGEAHCRHSALAAEAGGWDAPHEGCIDASIITDPDHPRVVTALALTLGNTKQIVAVSPSLSA